MECSPIIVSDPLLLFDREILCPNGGNQFPGKISSLETAHFAVHEVIAAIQGAIEDWMVQHVQCLARSYYNVTGESLVKGWQSFTPHDLARKVFEMPDAIVSHGTEKDPILNYGNRGALELWGMDWQEFVTTPSRYTAEEPDRAERFALLRDVERYGFVHDYSGIRVSGMGDLFRISNSTVWLLRDDDDDDDDGKFYGMAARIKNYKFL